MSQDSDFPDPGVGFPRGVAEPHDIVDARDPDARPVLLDGAVEGHVLVKNTKDTLPLKSPKMLSIFGYSAKSPDIFSPSNGEVLSWAWKWGAEAVDPQEVFSGFGGESDVEYSTIAMNGTMIHGGGSGGTTPALFISPFEALKMRAIGDGTALFHDFVSSEPLVDAASDACIVFGNAWSSESYDRPAIRDDYTDDLITAVADQCNKTIVVLHNAGIRLVDQFVDHPNVSAIIFAHLPGQETGRALVSMLYGDANPSGKLPYTVAKNESDYGIMLDPDLPDAEFEFFPQSDFDEGIYVDYRYFDEKDIEPRYEFGFGLSYTSFSFSDLAASIADGANTDEWPTGAVVTGGQADLWDRVASVSARVENTGALPGAEVAQLYIGIPNAPVRQLRGFEKVPLNANGSATVTFDVTRRDLSVWDTAAQKWQLQKGEYKVYVGNSSRELPLKGSLKI